MPSKPRLLVLSNLYPPHTIGGYEIGCQEVVEYLRSTGHDVTVLTSSFGVPAPIREGHVYRWLEAEISWPPLPWPSYVLRLLRKERRNQSAFLELLARVRPDLVYVWNLPFTSVSLPFLAERSRVKTAYYAFDEWLSHWRTDPWYSAWDRPRGSYTGRLRGLVRQILESRIYVPSGALDLSGAQFASEFLKRSAVRHGCEVGDAPVINWGVDQARFPYAERDREPRRLLYVGQLVRHKGVHTAIDAVEILSQTTDRFTLTIAGRGRDAEYLAELKARVTRAGLADQVKFQSHVPRAELHSIYAAHDLMIFPSVWDEPFGLTQLEAMATGMPVVGTATGGASEILRDGVNGLVFAPSDPESCAERVRRIANDLDFYRALSRGAVHTATVEFNLKNTLIAVEAHLQALARPVAGSAR